MGGFSKFSIFIAHKPHSAHSGVFTPGCLTLVREDAGRGVAGGGGGRRGGEIEEEGWEKSKGGG